MDIKRLAEIPSGELYTDEDLQAAYELMGELKPEDVVSIVAYVDEIEDKVAQALPEAGGVVWTEMYDSQTGQKYNVTSRHVTPEAAFIKLHAACRYMEQTYHLSPNRPAYRGKTEKTASQPGELPADLNDSFWAEGKYKDANDQNSNRTPTTGKDWGLIPQKLKASEAGFGDRYEVQVDEYEFDGAVINFYRQGMKYPEATHMLKTDYARQLFHNIFQGWQPAVGQRYPLPNGPIILEIVCTDASRKTSQGNPYHNIAGQRPVS